MLWVPLFRALLRSFWVAEIWHCICEHFVGLVDELGSFVGCLGWFQVLSSLMLFLVWADVVVNSS